MKDMIVTELRVDGKYVKIKKLDPDLDHIDEILTQLRRLDYPKRRDAAKLRIQRLGERDGEVKPDQITKAIKEVMQVKNSSARQYCSIIMAEMMDEDDCWTLKRSNAKDTTYHYNRQKARDHSMNKPTR